MIALICLLVRASRAGLASDYVDPVGKITAQDEGLYAHSAIRVARQGGWLTPIFRGWYGLYKPPLLTWVSGLSAGLLGITRIALRLPVALLASMGVGLVFLWTAETSGWQAGAAAGLLLAGNRLWHVLGSLCMADGLLAAFYTAAMYCLFSDPWLESAAALWGFAASVAAGILTRSVAGMLPLAALVLYWLAAPANRKPTFSRVCMAAALSLALAAPWFGYQLVAHGRWFWTEHVQVEIPGSGAGAPEQTSQENLAVFYLMRLAATDPVLLACAAVALPPFLLALRRRSADATLLACWLAVLAGALMGWQYRNASYLLPMAPALAIMAATHGPLSSRDSAPWMLLLVCAAALAKTAVPAAPFGLPFGESSALRAAAPLSDYCQRGRGNELIVVGLEDNLYASVLPLPQLRYCVVSGGGSGGAHAMPFDYPGIVVGADEFGEPARMQALYGDRLSEWGLDSREPFATLIVVRSLGELGDLIRAHPASDFFLPFKYRAAVQAATPQELIVASPDYFLLLSRRPLPRATPAAWGCRL